MTPRIFQEISSITDMPVIIFDVSTYYFVIPQNFLLKNNQYKYKNRVNIAETHQASLSSIKVGETPTLISLIDKREVSSPRADKSPFESEAINQLSFFTFKRLKEVKL